MKRATFLCPAMTTGGPEAIHQVAQLFAEQGLPTDIAYYGSGGSLSVAEGRLECQPPPVNPCLEAYAGYEPVVCRSALLRPHHLIVLPEVLAGHFAGFGRAGVAVWWLSVDNAVGLMDEVTQRAVVTSPTLRHFHQSAYAADFLRQVGVTTSLPLGDHTTAEFTAHVPTGPNAEPAIAYNPAKGADLAELFFGRHPELLQAPIQGMSRVEMAAFLRRTRVYVDFGHLPGRDRMPREAAASGSVVFLHDRGAGRYQEDFPIPDFFRFTREDVVTGELGARITSVQQDPAPYWAQQDAFRRSIRAERDDLRDQVAQLRGRARAA